MNNEKLTTKEFIKQVEEIGFVVEKDAEVYFIYDNECTEYAAVCHKEWGQISNDVREWDFLEDNVKQKLFDLLVRYAKTPLEYREEPKKYYLKHRYLISDNYLDKQRYNYLNKNTSTEALSLDDNNENPKWSFRCKFSLKEIEEIKEKYNTDLSDFKMIEVEE